MAELVWGMFWKSVFANFFFEVFGPIRGGGFRWFSMVLGRVGRSVRRSVGRSGGRSVGRSVGQALGRSVGSPSTPSPSPPPVTKEVLSDIASSVWELCLVWRRLIMGRRW